jgi:hypothetical protein
MIKVRQFLQPENRTFFVVTKIIFSVLMIIASASFMWYFYGDLSNWNTPSGYKPKKENQINYTDCVYFSAISWFTVGYGDFTVKNDKLKILIVFKIILSNIILLL